MRTCSIQGCAKPHLARGFCSMHYSRVRIHGDPDIVLTPSDTAVPLRTRFLASFTTGPKCWLWKGATTRSGYGRIKDKSRPIVAHRLAWEYAHGPIPAKMEVCHRCDNTGCVRPDHLFLGTRSENMRDMVAKGRFPKKHFLSLEAIDTIYTSTASTREIAKEVGASESYVWMLRTGRCPRPHLRQTIRPDRA